MLYEANVLIFQETVLFMKLEISCGITEQHSDGVI